MTKFIDQGNPERNYELAKISKYKIRTLCRKIIQSTVNQKLNYKKYKCILTSGASESN